MDRRSLLSTLGAVPALAAAADTAKRTRFFVLEQYYLRNGTQGGRIHDFLGKAFVPAMKRIHGGPVIVLDAVMAPHVPQVALITGYESQQQWVDVRQRAFGEKELMKAFEGWEAGDEAPYEHFSSTLLQ